MAEPTDPQIEPKEGDDKKPAVVPAETVDKLVESFQTTMAETVKEVAAAARPAAPAPAAGPTREEIQAQMATDMQVAAKRYADQSAEGNAEEAILAYTQAVGQIQSRAVQATAQPVESTADFKARVATAKRLAKSEHTEMFSEYGKEIQDEIDAMTAGERINPDSWDAAVTRVRSRHADDIINKTVETRLEEERKKFTGTTGAPMNIPGGNPQGGGAGGAEGNAGLTADQLNCAEACSVSPAQYAAALKRSEGPSANSMYGNILEPPKPGESHKPGTF